MDSYSGCRKARGSLIVFEGLDWSGKTTHSGGLARRLYVEGLQVERVAFPQRRHSIDAYKIRDFLCGLLKLTEKEASKLFSKQRHEHKEWMGKLLKEGTNVIVDRYYHSGIAYSVANGLDPEESIQQEVGLWKPDIVIYLDITPEVSFDRSAMQEERYDNYDTQAKVREVYRMLKDDTWVTIDALRDEEDIWKDVLAAAMKTVESCRYSPLETLADFHFDQVRANLKN